MDIRIDPAQDGVASGVDPARRTRMRARWVFWAFLAIAFAPLALEHRAHLPGLLPLLLLACPLMHVFMHHGHGRHHAGHKNATPPRE